MYVRFKYYLINNWPVKADQSSYEDYTASDLMTASCTPTMDNGTLRLDFVMVHWSALVVIEMPKTVYKFTDVGIPDYTVQSEATFTGAAKPLRMADGTCGDFTRPGQGNVSATLNVWMEKIAADRKNDFNGSPRLWSSSEFSGSYARFWLMDSDGDVCCHWVYKNNYGDVRPVLAF